MLRHVLKGAGALAVIAFLFGLSFYRLPAVTMLPGPVEDVLPQVKVGDRTPTYETSGRLFLTTVGVDAEINFYEALLQLADGDVEIVPRQQLYPEGRSEQEVNLENVAEMDASKLAATVVGLRRSGYEVDTDPDGVRVVGVVADGAAAGKLRANDRILEISGRAVSSGEEVRKAIVAGDIGDRLDVKVQRGRDTVVETLITKAAPTGERRPYVGVSFANVYDFPVDVQIEISDISGPSAGLMFSLAIVEKLGKEDLTGGRRIAGTGTLQFDGSVGEIGGIRQKLIAARRHGATVFLTPQGNYEEASRFRPDGLELIPVATVDDALGYLRRTSPSQAAGR